MDLAEILKGTGVSLGVGLNDSLRGVVLVEYAVVFALAQMDRTRTRVPPRSRQCWRTPAAAVG